MPIRDIKTAGSGDEMSTKEGIECRAEICRKRGFPEPRKP
jgi:hypothetical protein